VLYYIKVTKFVKLGYIDILEYFRVLYYIKLTKFIKVANFSLWKIFKCYTT